MVEKNNNICLHRSGNSYFLYDVSLIESIDEAALFDHIGDEFQDGSATQDTAIGRGSAVYFRYGELRLIFKHYQRGGMIAKLLHDQYLGFRPEKSRAYREWRLLDQLHQLDLPVPVPVVARVIKNGPFHQADMVMLEIENTETLADLCLGFGVSDSIWRNVGRCIRKFHDHDVYHADLNARNILIGEEDKVYLIDFDKGCFRLSNESWKASNLSRLHRSLRKFTTLNDGFHFSETKWSLLLEGYHST